MSRSNKVVVTEDDLARVEAFNSLHGRSHSRSSYLCIEVKTSQITAKPFLLRYQRAGRGRSQENHFESMDALEKFVTMLVGKSQHIEDEINKFKTLAKMYDMLDQFEICYWGPKDFRFRFKDSRLKKPQRNFSYKYWRSDEWSIDRRFADIDSLVRYAKLLLNQYKANGFDA